MLATCIELEAGRTLEHRPANRFDGPTNAADSCVAAEAAPLELTTAARPTLMSRATSFLRALHLDQRGSLRLPGQARTTYDAAEAFRRLEKFNGISPALASERLHGIKQAAGLGGADNVIFDLSGGVYHPETLEFLGTMTEGGAAGGVP